MAAQHPQNQICVRKNILLLAFIILTVLVGALLFRKTSSTKLTYSSKAAPQMRLVGGLGQSCFTGNKCSGGLDCYLSLTEVLRAPLNNPSYRPTCQKLNPYRSYFNAEDSDKKGFHQVEIPPICGNESDPCCAAPTKRSDPAECRYGLKCRSFDQLVLEDQAAVDRWQLTANNMPVRNPWHYNVEARKDWGKVISGGFCYRSRCGGENEMCCAVDECDPGFKCLPIAASFNTDFEYKRCLNEKTVFPSTITWRDINFRTTIYDPVARQRFVPVGDQALSELDLILNNNGYYRVELSLTPEDYSSFPEYFFKYLIDCDGDVSYETGSGIDTGKKYIGSCNINFNESMDLHIAVSIFNSDRVKLNDISKTITIIH